MLVAIPVISLLIFLPSNILGQNTKSTMTILPWDLQDDETLYVIIQTTPTMPSEKIEIVKRAILSEKSFTIDGKILYDGWQGAIKKASEHKTKFSMPTKFEIVESASTAKVITIILSPMSTENGYSGYTTFITSDHKISKPIITIYDVNDLTNQELAAVVRHEFGHALGLGHSTEYGDLMHEEIDLRSPFISECNIHALASLYNGKIMSPHFDESEKLL
jgi:hypothetical protein